MRHVQSVVGGGGAAGTGTAIECPEEQLQCRYYSCGLQTRSFSHCTLLDSIWFLTHVIRVNVFNIYVGNIHRCRAQRAELSTLSGDCHSQCHSAYPPTSGMYTLQLIHHMSITSLGSHATQFWATAAECDLTAESCQVVTAVPNAAFPGGTPVIGVIPVTLF